MKKIKNYFLVLFLKFLPIGRCYRLVSRIHNIRGYKVHENARIFSSVKIYGNIGLNISDGTYIGNETIITGGLANISIGENCDISDRVSIFCGSHEIDVFLRSQEAHVTIIGLCLLEDGDQLIILVDL